MAYVQVGVQCRWRKWKDGKLSVDRVVPCDKCFTKHSEKWYACINMGEFGSENTPTFALLNSMNQDFKDCWYSSNTYIGFYRCLQIKSKARGVAEVQQELNIATRTVASTVANRTNAVMSSIANAGIGAVNNIAAGLAGMKDGIEDAVTAGVREASTIFRPIRSLIDGISSRISDEAEDSMRSITENIDSLYTNSLINSNATLESVTGNIEALSGASLGGIISSSEEVVALVETASTTLVGQIESNIIDISEVATTLTDAGINAIFREYTSLSSEISEFITPVFESVETTVSELSKFSDTVGRRFDRVMKNQEEIQQPQMASILGNFDAIAEFFTARLTPEEMGNTGISWDAIRNTLIASTQDGEVGNLDDLIVDPRVDPLSWMLSNIGSLLSKTLLFGSIISIANAPQTEQFRRQVASASPAWDISVEQIINLHSRGVIDLESAMTRLTAYGIEESVSAEILTGTRSPLNPAEAISAGRRGIISTTEVDEYIARSGYNETDTRTLREVAEHFPDVQSLIMMAVREAFTPDVVSEFNLDGDLPDEFVDESAKLGMNRDWATKYWIAHWRLPSARQGFEMFHRRVIDDTTLKKLLRALDVSPFWRDKLQAIAYNPITRIDIRRMYKLGLIDRTEVVERHKDLGYSPPDADAMADFVVSLSDDPEVEDITDYRKLTVSQMRAFYRSGSITRNEALNQLLLLKYENTTAGIIVSGWDLQLLNDEREKTLDDAVAKIVIEGMDELTIESYLAQLTLTPVERLNIDRSIARMRGKSDRLPTFAQLRRMHAGGLVGYNEFRGVMVTMGYSEYWAGKIMASYEIRR